MKHIKYFYNEEHDETDNCSGSNTKPSNVLEKLFRSFLNRQNKQQ